MTRDRRRLVFHRIDDVMQDVDRLLPNHRTVGRWTLGQICQHLSCSLLYTVNGFPDPPAPWLLQATLGRLARWSMLYNGFIPEGLPVPARYRPVHGLDDHAEAEKLRLAIADFNNCAEPGGHPLVGRMTVAEWHRFHCIHCAHHLSFAIPLKSIS